MSHVYLQSAYSIFVEFTLRWHYHKQSPRHILSAHLRLRLIAGLCTSGDECDGTQELHYISRCQPPGHHNGVGQILGGEQEGGSMSLLASVWMPRDLLCCRYWRRYRPDIWASAVTMCASQSVMWTILKWQWVCRCNSHLLSRIAYNFVVRYTRRSQRWEIASCDGPTRY